VWGGRSGLCAGYLEAGTVVNKIGTKAPDNVIEIGAITIGPIYIFLIYIYIIKITF
jgi:hypothetical protein